MICINIRIIGFRAVSDKELYKICVNVDDKVLRVIELIENKLGLKFNLDEIMILCDDKQIYAEEPLPSNCRDLIIFPLALGG